MSTPTPEEYFQKKTEMKKEEEAREAQEALELEECRKRLLKECEDLQLASKNFLTALKPYSMCSLQPGEQGAPTREEARRSPDMFDRMAERFNTTLNENYWKMQEFSTGERGVSERIQGLDKKIINRKGPGGGKSSEGNLEDYIKELQKPCTKENLSKICKGVQKGAKAAMPTLSLAQRLEGKLAELWHPIYKDPNDIDIIAAHDTMGKAMKKTSTVVAGLSERLEKLPNPLGQKMASLTTAISGMQTSAGSTSSPPVQGISRLDDLSRKVSGFFSKFKAPASTAPESSPANILSSIKSLFKRP